MRLLIKSIKVLSTKIQNTREKLKKNKTNPFKKQSYDYIERENVGIERNPSNNDDSTETETEE